MNPSADKHIGRAVPRREDDRLLRGGGRYAADIRPDDCLHVVFARSTMPRCRVTECDVEAARESPGVTAVFTGADVAGLGALSVSRLLDLSGDVQFPVLAGDYVAAVGQPVAAVIAASVPLGLDAVDNLFIDFEEVDRATTRTGAFAGSWNSGDVDAMFARADHVVEARVAHSRLAPSPLEPRAVTVGYDTATDTVTVWLSTQTPHRARTELARILDLDEHRLRVIAPDVGGAFGMKASLFPEDVFVVWAAVKLRRSLKWAASRNEDFLSATHGRGLSTRGRLALSRDGDFLALRATIEAPLGHWLSTSACVPAWNAGRILPGGYRIAAIEVSTRADPDDHAAVGIYRGAGRPEAACLLERLVDEAAAVTGLDPVAIRERNLLGAPDFPYRTPAGHTLDSGRYREALREFVDTAGYDELRRQRDSRRQRGELVGLGVAFYIEPCGEGWESARVTLEPTGSVIAATGGSTQGHGRETAIAQIVADHLGVPMDDIRVLHGDSHTCPAGIGALASRSTPIGGSAMVRACEELRARVPAGLRPEEAVTSEVTYNADGEAWAFGAYLVLVSIDAGTGDLHIESAACLDDIGTVVNPILVDGQVMGGFAQGVGEALLEAVRYDEYDQLLTGSFTDYAMPRADTVPPLTIHKMSTPSPCNALGAKGVGEAGTIGAPAAILNAAIDALRPLGINDLQMPLGSEQLWRAIRAAREVRA